MENYPIDCLIDTTLQGEYQPKTRVHSKEIGFSQIGKGTQSHGILGTDQETGRCPQILGRLLRGSFSRGRGGRNQCQSWGGYKNQI